MTVWLCVNSPSSSEVLRNCYRLPFLVLIIPGRFPLPAPKNETASGMSFFEKKTEKIHKGSPPTVLCSLHTHAHTDVGVHFLTPTQKNSPTRSNGQLNQTWNTHFSLLDTHCFTLLHAHPCCSGACWETSDTQGGRRTEDRLFPHLDSMDTSDVGLNIESMSTKPALTQLLSTWYLLIKFEILFHQIIGIKLEIHLSIIKINLMRPEKQKKCLFYSKNKLNVVSDII